MAVKHTLAAIGLLLFALWASWTSAPVGKNPVGLGLFGSIYLLAVSLIGLVYGLGARLVTKLGGGKTAPVGIKLYAIILAAAIACVYLLGTKYSTFPQ